MGKTFRRSNIYTQEPAHAGCVPCENHGLMNCCTACTDAPSASVLGYMHDKSSRSERNNVADRGRKPNQGRKGVQSKSKINLVGGL